MQYQKRLDFEAPAPTPSNRGEEPVHCVPERIPTDTSLPPPLIRPDRQTPYSDTPHYEWPDAVHDKDTITVDRITGDIDGPPHRFVIKRADTVEAYFSKDCLEVGTVTGISHARNEVCVQFSDGTEGVWFSKGAIYPAPEPTPQAPPPGVPLSEIIEQLNQKHGHSDELSEADKVPPFASSKGEETIHPQDPQGAKGECSPANLERPAMLSQLTTYTFDEFKDFWKASADNKGTFDDYHETFERIVASELELVIELKTSRNAKQLKLLASRFGDWRARSNTKQENAESIYRKMLGFFLLDGTVQFGMGGSYTEAVKEKVRAVTSVEWEEHHQKVAQAQAENNKALADPQTLPDFSKFIDAKGEQQLTNEQMARWDALKADQARERRALNGPATTVTQFEAQELDGIQFTIKEGYHEKRECPLWIVQLSSRVERATFMELKTKAQMLGGWFSSFKKSDAGFQFLSEEEATRFTALLTSDADREDLLEARRERKELTASERLHELANTMTTRAEETIAGSEASLQNTARRADIQAGVRGRAYSEMALARSLHSVATALSSGDADYLDGIRQKTHLETLDSVLHLAKWARIRAVRKAQNEGEYGYGLRVQEEEEKPYSEEDIRFTEYPHPSIYKNHLEQAIIQCRTRKGAKMISERMRKRISRVKGDNVSFTDEHDIGQLADFLSRAKYAGYDTQWMDSSLDKYKRLQAARISDIHELRAALREYLPHKASIRGDDPVQIAERELIGKQLEGFFPTPRAIIDEMLQYADISPHQNVLEPSCGKGDIVTAIQEEHPDAQLTAIEMNRGLADVLIAKGIDVEFTDFLTHQGTYDRIVMNPPFERGENSDVDHVKHAFSLLASGGRLVSVMGEGTFFRTDKKSEQFRNWLDELSAETHELPGDAFSTSDAFRQTGVKTRLVVIDKA